MPPQPRTDAAFRDRRRWLWRLVGASVIAVAGGPVSGQPLVIETDAPEPPLPHIEALPEQLVEEMPAAKASVGPDATLTPDPALDAEAMRQEIDRAVEAHLAGIPRPRYIPATDLVPPRGLLLYKENSRRGDFPFALALGGYMQLRWLEFARGRPRGPTRPATCGRSTISTRST